MYGLSDELINKIRKISTENDIKLYIFGSRARGDCFWGHLPKTA